jgi:polyisoprenyl-phosphate glycosyltransferase
MTKSSNKYDLCILVPFYNDWECLNELLKQFGELSSANRIGNYKVVAINDCSTHSGFPEAGGNNNLEIVNLNRNVGHQKAIAIGLAYINDNISTESIVVMDADGEDDPDDIPRLYESMKDSNFSTVSFAGRLKRKEKFTFKLFYFFYKIIFKIFTGKKISFGNYSIIPYNILKRLVFMPGIAVHFSGAVINSGLQYTLVPCNRKSRYYGKSKMNFSGLILHGLSSVSVHYNKVATRLLLFSVMSIMLIFIAMLVILGIKLFSVLAIPGWTSNMIFLLLILGIEIFIMCVFLIFQILFQKNKFDEFIPALHYKSFIDTVNNF